GIYTVDYTYTDAKGCVNNDQGNVLVQFTEPPTTEDHTSMIELNEPVVIKANTLPDATVNWYKEETAGASLSTQNPWTTDDNPRVEVEKSYWASQTVHGCESKRTEAFVSIIDCPVPAPIVSIESPICNYEDTPEIQATVNPTWLTSEGRPASIVAPEFRVYTQETGGAPIETNTTGVYQPNIDKTKAGTHKFWVSEYNENVTPTGCEGPRTAIVLDIYRTAPVIVNSVEPICEKESNPSLTVTGKMGDIEWHLGTTPPTHPALTGSVWTGDSFTPSDAQISEVGTHKVYAVHKVNGCVSEAAEGTITIKPIPDAPDVTGSEICDGDANKQICATPSTGGTVSWFQTATSPTALRVASCYTPTVTNVDVHTFYALQEVNGCKSERVPVQYQIKPNPVEPIISLSSPQVCEYGENPLFTANGETGSTIKWYQNDGKTFLSDETTYTHVITGHGVFTYRASQVVDGCEGKQAPKSVEVIKTPPIPSVESKAICEGDTILPVFNSGDARTEWYRDEGTTDLLILGSSFTPDRSIVSNKDVRFYIKTRDAGCESDTSSFVLQVIPKPQITLIGESQKCIYDEGPTLQAEVTPAIAHAKDNILWNSPQATFNVESQTVEVELDDYFTQAGKYDVRVQYRVLANERLAKYCVSDFATHTYTVNNFARQPIVINKTICQGENIQPLQAVGSPKILWKALDSEPEIMANSTTYIFDNAELTPGIYRFELVDFDAKTGCRSQVVEYPLEVFPAANPTIYGRDSVCAFDSEVRYYTHFVEGSEYIWNITNEQTMYVKDDSYKNARYVDWSNPGYDTIRVTEITRGLCIDSAMIVVKTAPYPEPYFTWTLPGAQNVVEFRDSTIQDSIWAINEFGELERDIITYDLAWNFGKNLTNLQEIDSLITYENINNPYLRVGGYQWGDWVVNVMAINSFGCKSSYSDNIFVKIQTGLHVPNAFAPMNPAHGVRYFQPKGFNLNAMEVWVYDVWGNLVWYSDEVEDGNFVGSWNGTYNGKPLKSDMYIWKIEANFMDGQKWKGIPNGRGGYNTYGSVMLIR
ncbi:MAG: hypothetical protein GX277_04470, partial [Bacteroidales bacterium]|nr:hypothetical protein [Bacteroidales bacterium]